MVLLPKKTLLTALLWVVFVDSLGSGLAFSVFASLFFDPHSSFFSIFSNDSSRHIFYGILLGIYNLCMFFSAPIMGTISDSHGRKPILIFSMIGLTIGFFFSALGCLYGNLLLLIVGRIISGMTAGSLSVAQSAVVDISDSQTKSFYLALVVVANCMGFSVGPLIGHILLQNSIAPVGTLTFVVGAVLSAIGFILVFALFKETRTNISVVDKQKFINSFIDIKNGFTNQKTGYYLLSFALSMLAYCLFFSNIPLFVHSLSLADTVVMGYILSCLVVSLSLSISLAGKFMSKQENRNRIITFTQIIKATTFIALAFCFSSLALNIIMFILISICFGGIYIGLLTFISDATSVNEQGRMMGTIAAISSLSWFIGAWLSGYLNNIGAYIPSIICALFMCGAFAAYRKQKQLV